MLHSAWHMESNQFRSGLCPAADDGDKPTTLRGNKPFKFSVAVGSRASAGRFSPA